MSKDKARGYLRIMDRSDIVAFLHLLVDVLTPLADLSKSMQANTMTLAEVPTVVEAALLSLDTYKDK